MYKVETVDFSESKINKLVIQSYRIDTDVNDSYADIIIDNNKLLSYMREGKNDEKKKAFIKKILAEKIEKMPYVTIKNDGIFMSLISYNFIKQHYNKELLYLMGYQDIEKPKFGLDSVFYSSDEIFIVEFKSSISQLKTTQVGKKLIEGIASLFSKDSYDLATLEYCRDFLDEKDTSLSVLNKILDFYEKNRYNPHVLKTNNKLKFNVCIVSPLNEFSKNDIEQYIKDEYITCKKCKNLPCSDIKCERNESIQINDAIHIEIDNTFSLEKIYELLISKL